MAKPLLIVLHGSGRYTTDWATKHVQRMNELASSYTRIAERGSLSDQVEIVPLNYDTVFEDLLDDWHEHGDAVEQFVKATSVRLPGVVATLNDNTLPSDERGFLWSHVLDPVFYRGISAVRDQVRAVVMSDVVATINRHLASHSGADVSIMGHSLGTIVLHDVLHLLGTGQAAPSGEVIQAGAFRFSNVFQLANASRLGPPRLTQFKPYDSHTRPVSANASKGGFAPYCDFMTSFRNELDPVTWWQSFRPTGWGDGYFDVKVSHFRHLNVHGFIHYLEHPNVHVQVLRGLLGFRAVSAAEHNAQLSGFPDLLPNTCGDAVARLLIELSSLRNSVNGGSLDEVAMGLYRLYKAVKTAKERCESLFNDLDGFL